MAHDPAATMQYGSVQRVPLSTARDAARQAASPVGVFTAADLPGGLEEVVNCQFCYR